MTQIEQRATFFVRILREVRKNAPISAYAVAKRVGYSPRHIYRWTKPLVGVGVLRSRAAGLSCAGLSSTLEAKLVARAAAQSLGGKRRVKPLDSVRAELVVEKLLGVALSERPMTRFD